MEERVRELLDRARDTAVTAGDYAEAAARRAGQAVDAAKLNLGIFRRKADVNGLLREIGQLVYDARRGGTADSAALEEMLRRIDRKNAEAGELRRQADRLKNGEICPRCGALCGTGDRFCKHCGGAL